MRSDTLSTTVQLGCEGSVRYAVWALEGSLDTTAREAFDEALSAIESEPLRKLILDFERVSYMSSAGYAALISLAGQARDLGAELAIASAGGSVRSALDLTGVTALVPTFPSVEDAVEADVKA